MFTSRSNIRSCNVKQLAMNYENHDSIIVNAEFVNDHASDINYSIKYTRWFLRMLGIWPFVMSNPTTHGKYLAKILRPLLTISMTIIIIPMLAEIIVQRGDSSELIVLLSPIAYQTANIIKYFFIILRSDVIKICVQHMETDWQRIDNSREREIMMKNVRDAHTLTIIFTLCMYGSSTLYNVALPLCSGSTINEFNETIRPLGYPGADIFFDVQASFTYEIVYCSYCFSVFAGITVSMGVFNLAVILVRHTCGQIQIVISRLERLISPGAENIASVIENRIAFIVQSHARLLGFAKNVEKVLREMFLMEMIAETLIICLLEYYCITEWNNSDLVAILTYGMLLGSFSFNIFIYCQVGEVLTEQCHEIGKAACMIEWYKLPGKTSLALVMIINMSADSRKLTAAGMMELSRASFASVMKTSFAYLNILSTVV